MTRDELIQARRQAGMTTTDLASALGVHQRTIDRYETGESPITRLASIALRAVFESRLAVVSSGQVETKTQAPRRSSPARKVHSTK